MIKSITVTNPKNESLKLELARPELSGLIVRDVKGLGPPKIDVLTNTLSTTDGSLFSSTRAETRNIVFSLDMMFHPTIEASRLLTYQYFPIKKKIDMVFETDRRRATISGYVETNEPNIFSKEENTQISVLCPDPWFYELGESRSVFSGVRAMFEFPFSNESLTQKLIEFGEILVDTRAILNYDGDVDTGVTITIHATGDADMITLHNVDTYETMKIDTLKISTLTGEGLHQGDDIIISTVKGAKSAYLLRKGVYTNILSAIDKDSNWFQLSSGTNIFRFQAQTGEENLMVTFSYRNAYGGI